MSDLSGRCFCGAVRYSATPSKRLFVACHCRDCQYASGGAPANVVVVPRSHFTLEAGGDTLGAFTCIADSGRQVTRKFCLTCGTPMFEDLEAVPEFILVKAGTVDDQSGLSTDAAVWTASAQPWSEISDHYPSFPGEIPQSVVAAAFSETPKDQ